MSDTSTGPGEVTTYDESVGEFQERKFLEQVYDSFASARRAVSEWEVGNGADGDGQRIAVVALSDTVRLVEPMLRESEWWTESLGEVEMLNGGELQRVSIDGLGGFLRYRDGYETIIERETPGRGSNTVTETVRVPLPERIVTTALRALTQFLHEEGLLDVDSGETRINPGAV